MALVVADSDVLIDFLRKNDGSNRVRELLSRGVLSTTTVSAFELHFGAQSKKQSSAVQVLLEALRVYDLTQQAALKAAEIAKALEKSGHRVGMADCLIAGICLEIGAKLLTNNRKHFERISGLALI